LVYQAATSTIQTLVLFVSKLAFWVHSAMGYGVDKQLTFRLKKHRIEYIDKAKNYGRFCQKIAEI